MSQAGGLVVTPAEADPNDLRGRHQVCNSSSLKNLRFANPKYRLDRLTALGIGNSPIDVAEVIELDQPVKGKLSCQTKPYQFRDKKLRHGIAFDDAKGFPSFCQTRPGLARKEGYNSMGIQHVDSELVHLRNTRGFHYVINTTTGDLRNSDSDVLTAIVDHMGNPQIWGEFETMRFNVDTYDGIGTNDAGSHDGGQADRSCTEDGNACPC